MSRTHTPSAALLIFLFSTGCSEDDLVGHRAALFATAYEPQNYKSYDDAASPVRVDLGDIPVYGRKTARFSLENPTTQILAIDAISVQESSGETWEAPVLHLGAGENLGVPAVSSRILDVTYAARVEGAASARVVVTSNARNGPTEVEVVANGVYQGEPDIEIRIGSASTPAMVGPNLSSCDANLTDGVDDNSDGVTDGCSMGAPYNMGGVGLGSTATTFIYIVNTAQCAPFPGAEPCGTCVLTLDRDPTRQNIGVGIKPGTNPFNVFSIGSSTSMPAALPQDDEGCSGNNVAPVILQFHAPSSEGTYETTLVVESNDPDEPLIEIPIKVASVNAPVAIAGLRAFDVANPSAPYSIAGDIEPYDRVHFDGRAKGSTASTYDPRDPGDTDLIADYTWEIIDAPAGADAALYAQQGQGTGLFSFYLPLAGHYEVMLTATNVDGLDSLDTPQARVAFDAIPSERLHVQLVWDNASNDQDLHLTYASEDDRVCNIPNDCHWRNKKPRWFTSAVAGEGGNPSLDVDDTNGFGPENINIEDPEPGTYRMYVHYYSGWPAGTSTRCTIRVWLNGLQVAEYQRTLGDADDLWAVGDITWLSDGTGLVTPYPSDTPGQVGAIGSMTSCTSPGVTF